uniref:MYND-type domain-containing protein n=1 Tax=Tetradesmus obliquus TaxID=3088 RepID=A0A383WQD1_TETOB|eukprot:jgi/Sobl393_1/18808/SZX79116.1
MPPGAGLDAAAIFKLLQQLAEVTDDSLAQDKLETVLAILKYLKSNTEVIEKMNKERVVLASATALTNSLQQLSCGPQASSQAAVCMRHIGKILRTSASTYEIQTGKKTPDLPYQHPRKRTDEEKEVCARQKVLAQAVAATGCSSAAAAAAGAGAGAGAGAAAANTPCSSDMLDDDQASAAAAAAALLGSAELQQLAALQIAFAAQIVHDDSGNTGNMPCSPTKHGKPSLRTAAPTRYSGLFASLNLSHIQQELLKSPDTNLTGAKTEYHGWVAYPLLSDAACYLRCWARQGGLKAAMSQAPAACSSSSVQPSSSSSSSSSSSNGGGPAQPCNIKINELPPWVLPVCLTCCETAVSWPGGPGCSNTGIQSCASLFCSLVEGIEAAASQQADAGDFAAAASLATPVLHMLGLAAVRGDSIGDVAGDNEFMALANKLTFNLIFKREEEAVPQSDTELRQVRQQELAQLYSDLLAAFIRADEAAGTRHMVSAFSQQPAVSAAAVELAMRGSPSSDLVRFVAEHLEQAVATGDMASQPAHASWLFSMLVTAAKATLCIGGSSSSGSFSSSQLSAVARYSPAAGLCNMAKQLAQQCSAANSCGSSGQPGSPSKKRTGKSKAGSTGGSKDGGATNRSSGSDDMLWPVLAARCVFVMCQLLEHMAEAEDLNCTPASQQHSDFSPATAAAAADDDDDDELRSLQEMASSLAAATSCLGELLQGLQQLPAAPGSQAVLQPGPAATATRAAGATPTRAEHAAAKVSSQVNGSATIKASRRPASAPAGKAAKPAGTAAKIPTLSQLLSQYMPLQQALDAAAAAAAAAAAPCSSCAATCDGTVCRSGVAGPELVAKVKAFAEQACAAQPLLDCCGNPACMNLDKRSETVLVRAAGSRKRPRCKACRYCSRECQVAAWRLHKPVCKHLQEAAASTRSSCNGWAAGVLLPPAGILLLDCCGNPGCLNLGKRSETVLANGSRKCPRCKACRYCSRECQLAGWALHRPICKLWQEAKTSGK